MKNKVDKGFELNYWNLSYRRKFIRNLWQMPICVLLLGFCFLIGDNLIINRIVPVLIIIEGIGQIIYTYIKWKNEE
ncbi:MULTISPECIES: hypothetical protein [unclassified Clostridium]|uniref:hypothetical protein n=1 Tax=Clostridium TaxID=1485 RepID=UPI001C8B128C|nr:MULTISPECIES: hypothetical protein [unclassified Clostridium]MBX9138865.1 hypothetical protein [Clostridium sp. K12(2020)]MBX9145631.1 hypothetical protein [Clostridium sp. K13]